MDYSKLIKELRGKLILSQTELAELLGVSFASVNRWKWVIMSRPSNQKER